MTTTKGIPTMYQHCQFRSRLEAKWASFFDLCGWKWEYEPFDLNGWIPDFLLLGDKEQVLVEVKPYTTLAEFDTEKITKAMKGSHAESKDVLLLGCTIFEQCPEDSKAMIGWLGEYDTQAGGHYFGKALLCSSLYLNQNYTAFGFFHETNDWRDRMGLTPGGRAYKPYYSEMILLWHQANNNVQWMPRGTR